MGGEAVPIPSSCLSQQRLENKPSPSPIFFDSVLFYSSLLCIVIIPPSTHLTFKMSNSLEQLKASGTVSLLPPSPMTYLSSPVAECPSPCDKNHDAGSHDHFINNDVGANSVLVYTGSILWSHWQDKLCIRLYSSLQHPRRDHLSVTHPA